MKKYSSPSFITQGFLFSALPRYVKNREVGIVVQVLYSCNILKVSKL